MPLEPLLILYMVHYAYSKTRDLFLAPAQSAGVDCISHGWSSGSLHSGASYKFQLALFCSGSLESVPGPLTRLRAGQLEFHVPRITTTWQNGPVQYSLPRLLPHSPSRVHSVWADSPRCYAQLFYGPWNPSGPSIKLHDSSRGEWRWGSVLGAFAKLRKAALCCFLSVRMAQLGFH